MSLLLTVATIAAVAAARPNAPCDIYALGNTPCVAAHSTTRSLYKGYNQPLYEVTRGSDNATRHIMPLKKNGIASTSPQDVFCANTTCLITTIYDQSGNKNHLKAAPPGGFTAGPQAGGGDFVSSAYGAPAMLGGHKVYGVFISPGTGYRIDNTTGVATGNDAQGIYAVLDGTHWNDGCCFDYGNAEVSNSNTGSGHMQAIYYGNNTIWSKGAGNGPWVMADLENGLFSSDGYAAVNDNDPTQSSRFLTAIVKGNNTDYWEIKGGNANSGTLFTYFNGTRAGAWYPLHQEGSIILGIGGDNSDSGQGTFYEGIMTRAFPSDETEAAVQANIVKAGYKIAPLVSGPTVQVGSTITMRATNAGYNTTYIAHDNEGIITTPITSSNSQSVQQTGMWKVVEGLGNSGCVSFESVDTPNNFIRQSNFQLYLNPNTGDKQFMEDATFCPQASLTGEGTNSIRSWNYPTRLWRNFYNVMFMGMNGGPAAFDGRASYNDEVSFVISNNFIAA